MLGVLKSIRKQIGKNIGDTITVELWKDAAVGTVEVPANFQSLLEQKGLLPFFKSLSYTHRKEYVRWTRVVFTEVFIPTLLARLSLLWTLNAFRS